MTQRSTTTNVPAEVAIDLLVPASVSPGKGRRAARLAGHDSRVARIVSGLDGALVDVDMMSLAALDADPRRFDVRVAGPAALLVAKAHKINERKGTDRQSDRTPSTSCASFAAHRPKRSSGATGPCWRTTVHGHRRSKRFS